MRKALRKLVDVVSDPSVTVKRAVNKKGEEIIWVVGDKYRIFPATLKKALRLGIVKWIKLQNGRSNLTVNMKEVSKIGYY